MRCAPTTEAPRRASGPGWIPLWLTIRSKISAEHFAQTCHFQGWEARLVASRRRVRSDDAPSDHADRQQRHLGDNLRGRVHHAGRAVSHVVTASLTGHIGGDEPHARFPDTLRPNLIVTQLPCVGGPAPHHVLRWYQQQPRTLCRQRRGSFRKVCVKTDIDPVTDAVLFKNRIAVSRFEKGLSSREVCLAIDAADMSGLDNYGGIKVLLAVALDDADNERRADGTQPVEDGLKRCGVESNSVAPKMGSLHEIAL